MGIDLGGKMRGPIGDIKMNGTAPKANRKLRDQLTAAISDKATIGLVAKDAGLNMARLNPDGAPELYWDSVLGEAERAGKLPSVLQQVVERVPALKYVSGVQISAFDEATEAEQTGLNSREAISTNLARLGRGAQVRLLLNLLHQYDSTLTKGLGFDASASELHSTQVLNADELEISALCLLLIEGERVTRGSIVAGARLNKPLKSGAFSTVWLSTNDSDSTQCVIKVFSCKLLHDPRMLTYFHRGIRAIERLNAENDAHPSIVQLQQVSEDGLAFRMPYYPHGDLEELQRLDWTMNKKIDFFCGSAKQCPLPIDKESFIVT